MRAGNDTTTYDPGGAAVTNGESDNTASGNRVTIGEGNHNDVTGDFATAGGGTERE